ncbi:MAG: endonuclease/exonuclease/phosphatase family protein [candidate division KSB1 bacterium]|nr:endonuclease/exonuclease/phosphatase family protein [candidate division KSB1 bacterium]
MNKFKTIILSLIWLCILCLELIVWNVTIRSGLFSVNAVTDMGASLLSDVIWIPVALLLPFIAVGLISKQRPIPVKMLLYALAVCIALAGLLYLPTFFRYLFVLLILYFVILLYSAYRESLSVHHLFYTLVVLCLVYHYNTQLLPPVKPDAKAPQNLRVMSWNIGMDAERMESEQMVGFIRRENPDIICIQEFQTGQRRVFVDQLSDQYPYQKWSRRVSDYGGGAILSRLPFLHSELVSINSEYDPDSPITITHASVSWRDKQIDVYNCHLHHSANYLLEQFMGKRDFKLYNHDAQTGYMRHRDEARQLASRLFPVERPLIVTGDFNDTPNSWVYQLYSKYLKNSFASAGWGLGTTFAEYRITDKVPVPVKAEKINILRIDHIFYSHDFQAFETQVYNTVESGHKPQIVTLVPLF